MNNFKYKKKEIILGKAFIHQRFSSSIINLFIFFIIFTFVSLIFFNSSPSSITDELKNIVTFNSNSFSVHSLLFAPVAVSLLIQSVISVGFLLFNSQNLAMFFTNTKFYKISNKQIKLKELLLILAYKFVKVWLIGYFIFFLYVSYIATRILAIILIICLIFLYFWIFHKFAFSLSEILTKTKKMVFYCETKEPYVSLLPEKTTILFTEIIEKSFDKNQENLTKEYHLDDKN